MRDETASVEEPASFYDQPQVEVDQLPIGEGVTVGIERVSNPELGIAGAYGTWGKSYDNHTLRYLIEELLGEPMPTDEDLNLSDLGFSHRQHLPSLTKEEQLEVELEVGARFLRQAALANGWDPSEVQGVIIGATAPPMEDYTEKIAERAGIPDEALKVSIHKACDSSMGGLHLALNPDLPENSRLPANIAEELRGKKILVGGIEGISRIIQMARDKYALQLFGNGAGVIGVIPGETMRFLAGRTREVFDESGLLQVHMFYPHSGILAAGKSMLEVAQTGLNQFRIAGLMHEPEDGSPVNMAGPMGMVKLFVRSGVEVVRDAFVAYQEMMERVGLPDKNIKVAIVHHANLKINQLKAKHLRRVGVQIPMPWVLSEFGNVSAASNMIAFLRKLSALNPGDHILFDGFGAGTYYDAFTVELSG